MEPTNHPFRKKHDLPNLHDYVPAVNLPGCKNPLNPFEQLGPSAACPLPFAGPYYARGQGNWGSKGVMLQGMVGRGWGWYCWWTKSCTTKDDDYPIIYRVLTIPGGAGFCPSTVGVALKFGSLAIRVFSNLYLGGGFKDFSKFSPQTLGEMIQFWRAYFSDGWFNHQLGAEIGTVGTGPPKKQ